MNEFDAKAYRNDVLKPSSRGEQLARLKAVIADLRRDPASTAYASLDLQRLYALPSVLTDEALRERFERKVLPALNKASAMPSAALLKQLHELMAAQGKDLFSPSFWESLAVVRSKSLRAELDDGIQKLSVEYPLGLVTEGELATRLAGLGLSDLPKSEVLAAARAQKLDVVPDLELPDEGLPANLRRPWAAVTRHSEFRSIFDILLLDRPPDEDSAGLIGRLAVGTTAITVSDIESARQKGEQLRDSDPLQDARKMLGALKDHCRDDAGLRDVVVLTVIDLISTQLERGMPRLAVRDDLILRGITRSDAGRLVHAVAAGAGGDGAARVGLEVVRDLLRDGQLSEAERTLVATTPDAEEAGDYSTLIERVEQLKERKRSGVAAYRSHHSARDFDAAAEALRNAIAVDRADESLDAMLAALPPLPPRTLKIRTEGTAVVLTWAGDSDGATRFTVVRAEGRVPAGPDDGTRVAEGVTSMTVTDTVAPTATLLGYAVLASRDGETYSDAATAVITILAPANRVSATTDLTSTEVSWELPAKAAGTVVTRLDPDGASRSHELPAGRSLRMEDLITGARYRVSVQAVYLLSSGRQVSEAVSVAVVPRGPASEVRDLDVLEVLDGDDRQVLEATWSAVQGFEVVLWAFPREVDVRVGQILDDRQLERSGGERLAPLPAFGAPSVGGKGGMRFASLPTVMKIVPVTIVDSGGLIGLPLLAGSAPTPAGVTVETFGTELRLSWEWPDGNHIVEVGWRSGPRRLSRRISRARYREDGGVRIADAANVEDLTLATVVKTDGEDWTSPAAAVPLGDSQRRIARARYSLRMKRSLLSGRVRCVITADNAEPGSIIPVEVVRKQGGVMPYGPEDGQTVARIELDFTAATSVRHELALEKQRSPFWICVFPVDPAVHLEAPPTAQMKG